MINLLIFLQDDEAFVVPLIKSIDDGEKMPDFSKEQLDILADYPTYLSLVTYIAIGRLHSAEIASTDDKEKRINSTLIHSALKSRMLPRICYNQIAENLPRVNETDNQFSKKIIYILGIIARNTSFDPMQLNYTFVD